MTRVHWQRTAVRTRQGMISIMVGRKRKQGRRKPSGRLTQPYVNPLAFVISQPHRATVPAKVRHDARAESAFGRLVLRGKITEGQYLAGRMYAEAAHAYRAVLHAPSPFARSAALDAGGGGTGGEMDPNTALRIRERYNAAYEALGEAGQRAQRAVARYAVNERACDSSDDLNVLCRGLDELIVHYGLDGRARIISRAKCKLPNRAQG